MELAGLNAALSDISSQLRTLSTSVQALQNNQDELQASQAKLKKLLKGQTKSKAEPAAAVTLQSPEPQGAAYAPEPRLPMPDKFSGDRTKYRTFVTACEVLFTLLPRTFHSDYVCVRTVISLLSGEPQLWAHQMLLSHNPALDSWASFLRAMNNVYDDPFKASSSHSKLRNLRQDKREVEEYVSDFRRLSLDSTWNEPALLDQFRHGLSEALKDELAHLDFPQTLNQAMALCIKLDRRLRERRQEKAAHVSPMVRTGPRPRPPPQAELSTDEPMQIGSARGPLTEQERRRRRLQGLCLYCGNPGHILRLCKLRPAPHTGRLSACSPSVPAANHSSHLLVLVSLQWDQKSLPIQAMLDSGASGVFIDETVVQLHDIPTRPKNTPITIQLIDGTPIRSGPVTRETVPLQLALGSGHLEPLALDIVATPVFPLVLGLPWLRKHNPHINWETGTLTLSSQYCREHCLSLPQGMATHQAPPGLPSYYHDFADVFELKGIEKLPPHRPYDCAIDLVPGAPIPFGRIYPLSEPELQTLKSYIDEHLKKGFIRPSSSPAGAGIFFIPKKDGGVRPCIDYRALNEVTIKNKYPLPLIPELLDRLRGAKVFTKLDLRGAYNLVRVKEGDEWKTAFRTRYGHFEYMVMPFGLCNAPATFQQFVNDIFRDVLDVFLIVYLDDILIYSPDLQQHRNHMRTVLQRLRENQLFAKIEKCEFEVSRIEFLGYVITPQQVHMDPRKVTAVVSWPVPRTRRDVQSFLGFSNFYRRFIRGFSQEVRPLTCLTRKDQKFAWTDAAQKAFQKLKDKFTTAPILAIPNPDMPYYMEVDASDVAAGAVLSQRQEAKGHLHPVAFFSKAFSQAEKNYDVSDRELLAVKLALEEWRHHLEGANHPVTVLTDHKNLEYLQRAKRLKARQARWSLFFTRFNLHFTYLPGSKNGKADALSRLPQEGGTETPSDPAPILPPQFFAATTRAVWESIKKATASMDTGELLPSVVLRDGFRWLKGRVVVPKCCIPLVLEHFHDSPLAGHGGLHQTKELVQRSFWWKGWSTDIQDYISACVPCSKSKDLRAHPQGLLQPLPVPARAWSDWAMDFLVDLPRSGGCTAILVVVDRLTKMAHFIALQGLPSAKETAEHVVREVVRLHGLPESITTDRGSQFTSRFWEALCANLHIQRNLSTAFHPRTNGQTERTNQTLEQYLRCYTAQTQDEWLQYLPLAEFAFNNHLHRSIGHSPFFSNYGFHPTMLPCSPIPCATPGAQVVVENLTKNYSLIKETLKRAQESYKKYFDRNHRPAHNYKVGESVWLSTANIKMALPCKKLGPRVIGPYVITEVVSPSAMKLRLPPSFKIHPVFHVSLLRPVTPDRFPYRGFRSSPDPVIVDGEEEFVVRSILDSRLHYGHLQYLVAWKGYGPEENTWVPVEEVRAPALLRAFHLSHPGKPSPASRPPQHDRPRSSAPPPRPRGRPRSVTSSLPSSAPSSLQDDHRSGFVPAPVVPARPRGRPRRSPVLLSPPASSSSPALLVPRRPRGRPRKFPPPLSLQSPDLPVVGPTPSASLPPPPVLDVPAVAAAPRPPRPRGRPRKYPLVAGPPPGSGVSR